MPNQVNANPEMKRSSDTTGLLAFPHRNWGGRRVGAGRKPAGGGRRSPHGSPST